MNKAKNLGELRKQKVPIRSVKEEIRLNLMATLRTGKKNFSGIIGYEETVIPQMINALLAKHDFILLGLRGQAKSRLLRQLTQFLDDEIPAIEGCPLRCAPYGEIIACNLCVRKMQEMGDQTPIEWIGREDRFREKLATPDVTIADLLGDVDPIKAATKKLEYSNEEVIHYGIIPRSNRGIFAINELPDLQPRIQVGLFSIMEERELQIRGFPLRIPMDILMVYSANPEDYTNRGNIITPLRDRIASQILTHYPSSLESSMQITQQESWIQREEGKSTLEMPLVMQELVEQIAFSARTSEFVDQNSGVSARLSISAMENIISNIERRCLLTQQSLADEYPRIIDLFATLPSITGKIELVYEGEQDGIIAVAHRILGNAILTTFYKYLPQTKKQNKLEEMFKDVIDWFAQGNRLELRDEATRQEYRKALQSAKGLENAVQAVLPQLSEKDQLFWMEFALEALHQKSFIDREHSCGKTLYQDMVRKMLEGM